VLTETAARWLLVLHLALGVAAVGAATHLVIWLRPYLRGEFARHRAVRRFAVISLLLHLGGFAVGHVVYPTYRVEVRAAMLENSAAVAKDVETRQAVIAKIAAKEGARPSELAPAADTIKTAAAAARWFDVKEHWIALGLFASLGLVLLLWAWDPKRDGAVPAPVVFWLAVVVAGTLWIAAIIGVLTATWRAI
jgi:hypothetical protein